MNPLSECDLSVEVIDNGDDPIIRYTAENIILYKLRRSGIEEARRRSKAVPADERKDSPIHRFWEDFTDMGVYFYVGNNTDGPGLDVYIGECGNVYDRFRSHRTDEWQGWTELLFVHRDRMTVATRFKLEELCIGLADGRPDVRLVNGKKKRTENPTPMELKTVRSIMKMLPNLMYVSGYGFLLGGTGKPEAPETGTTVTDGRPVFLIKGDSGVLGTGTVVDGEFWVCRGTRLKPRTRHFQKGDRAIYDALVSDGTIVGDQFERDWKADSHVVAARMVLGTTGGDMKYKWKTSDSVMVDAYLRSQAEKKDE